MLLTLAITWPQRARVLNKDQWVAAQVYGIVSGISMLHHGRVPRPWMLFLWQLLRRWDLESLIYYQRLLLQRYQRTFRQVSPIHL